MGYPASIIALYNVNNVNWQLLKVMINYLVKYFLNRGNLDFVSVFVLYSFVCEINNLLEKKSWVFFDTHDWAFFIINCIYLLASFFFSFILLRKYSYCVYGNKSEKIKSWWRIIVTCMIGLFIWFFSVMLYKIAIWIYDLGIKNFLPGNDLLLNIGRWMDGPGQILQFIFYSLFVIAGLIGCTGLWCGINYSGKETIQGETGLSALMIVMLFIIFDGWALKYLVLLIISWSPH